MAEYKRSARHPRLSILGSGERGMRRFYLMLIPYYASKKGSFDRALNRSFYDGCKGTQRRRKRTRGFFIGISCVSLCLRGVQNATGYRTSIGRQ